MIGIKTFKQFDEDQQGNAGEQLRGCLLGGFLREGLITDEAERQFLGKRLEELESRR